MSEINNNSTAEELNEVVEEVVDDATVMTVPIDDTLSISGEAADAKAVGDALATKIGQGEALTRVTVNGVASDAQGAVNITGADIPMSSASGAATVGAAMDTMNQSLSEMEQEVETATQQAGAAVKTVNGVTPDENGNVALADSGAVLSVNGVTPDENGDVTIEDPGTVKTVTSSFSITSTQGTISQMSALKCGAMIALQFRLTTSQIVPADGTLSATVSCDSSMRPVGITPGEVSLASVQNAKITTGGAVSAKATERLQAGADIITFYFTYMCINR